MAEFAPPEHNLMADFFDYNGLATQPYMLREIGVGLYRGESLQVLRAGGFNHLPIGRYLVLPPTYAAVVLLDNGEHQVFLAGKHTLASALRGRQPVSLQFVSTEVYSFHINGLKIYTKDRFLPEVDIMLSAYVEKPEQVITWKEPMIDLRAALNQALTRTVADLTHTDYVTKLPHLLEDEASSAHVNITRRLAQFGMELKGLFLQSLRPDPAVGDLEREKQLAPLRSYVERLKAQVDEDIAAMKQTGNRRNIMATMGAQARERNQAARMEAIDAVSNIAKLLFEDYQRNPGRVYSQKDLEPLMKALTLLEKLSDAVPPPPVPQQVRSSYAVDANQPAPPILGDDPFTTPTA